MKLSSVSADPFIWDEGEFFHQILNMSSDELWITVFGVEPPSSEESHRFYSRITQEIKLSGREIVSAREDFITKRLDGHMSDFLHNLTRGLCVFEERLFPKLWLLQNECCAQAEYTKDNMKGRYKVEVNIRLHQIQIVLRETEMSFVGNYIPKVIEDDSKTSIFHNVHRFYRKFLEYSMKVLFDYEVVWITEGGGTVESEMLFYKSLFPLNLIEPDSMRSSEEKESLNHINVLIAESPSEKEESVEEEELLINEEQVMFNSEQSDEMISNGTERDGHTIGFVREETPVSINIRCSQSFSEDPSIETRLKTMEKTEYDFDKSLAFIQSHGKDFNFSKVKEMIAPVIENRKRCSLDNSLPIKKFRRPSRFGPPLPHDPISFPVQNYCELIQSFQRKEEHLCSVTSFPMSSTSFQIPLHNLKLDDRNDNQRFNTPQKWVNIDDQNYSKKESIDLILPVTWNPLRVAIPKDFHETYRRLHSERMERLREAAQTDNAQAIPLTPQICDEKIRTESDTPKRIINDFRVSIQLNRPYSRIVNNGRTNIEDRFAPAAIISDDLEKTTDFQEYISFPVAQQESEVVQNQRNTVCQKPFSFKIQGRKVLRNTVALE